MATQTYTTNFEVVITTWQEVQKAAAATRGGFCGNVIDRLLCGEPGMAIGVPISDQQERILIQKQLHTYLTRTVKGKSQQLQTRFVNGVLYASLIEKIK